MNRELSLLERIALRYHTLVCSACRRYSRQLQFISTFIRSSADRIDEIIAASGGVLTDEARSRIRKRIIERE